MLVSAYDYELPLRSIAQQPMEPRSAARLMLALHPHRRDPSGPAGTATIEHRQVADLEHYICPGDIVVVNETRVLPARLLLAKATGGAAEVLLLEQLDERGDEWAALVRPGRRLPPGTVLYASAGGVAVAEVGAPMGGPRDESGPAGAPRRVRLLAPAEAHGTVPLPPYIRTELQDPSRYQTVYARIPGSVAAPTAGLHLTTELLEAIRRRGAQIHTLDLAVGAGTFRPITTDRVDDHVMHEERYAVPESTLSACAEAERVIAIGTTTLRALEAAAATGRAAGRTRLFIRPGYEFKVVDLLLTNFHLPRSTLLVLLAAFAGETRWRRLYETALQEGYRFLSFGDAMLVDRG